MKPKTNEQLFLLVLEHSKLDKLINSQINYLLNKYKLSLPKWLVLTVIKDGKKDGLSMTAVATATEMSLSQVATISTGLINHRYARQHTQEDDKRSRHLIITDKGQRLLNKLDLVFAELYAQIDKTITPGDLQKHWQTSQELAHIFRELKS